MSQALAAEVAPTAPTPRTGGALFRATAPYAKEDGRSWSYLAQALAVFGALEAIALLAPWWLAAPAAIVLGLVVVRLFIFVHDHLHGALFRKSKAGALIMNAIAMFMLTPPSVWRETHDYHHRNNAKFLGAAIGSYPLVTKVIYANMSPSEQRNYTALRHPLNMIFGYLTVFSFGMCISPFLRAPAKHWAAPAALLLHWAAAIGLSLTLGWQAAIFGLIGPVALSHAAGAYLFYAQHNFPDAKLRDRTNWDYSFAALRSSSMFDMPALMHWFTGNIGYHHVHHLNHRIPFYRLPEAMEAVPELQNPGRTSWAPADVTACLRLKLYDLQDDTMIGWQSAP